ncbi:MAG: hypothetical protein JWN15_4067 [Firmicutes bacterium]|nr:hypothetical protein [Bacillota bacterium]
MRSSLFARSRLGRLLAPVLGACLVLGAGFSSAHPATAAPLPTAPAAALATPKAPLPSAVALAAPKALLPTAVAPGGPVTKAPDQAYHPATAAIDADLSAGKLSLDDALLYKLLLLRSQAGLPRAYRPTVSLHDGTPIVMDITASLAKASPTVQQYIQYWLASPDARKKLAAPTLTGVRGPAADAARSLLGGIGALAELTYTTPAGHFAVHYYNSGTDTSTLAYAQELGGYFEQSWSYYSGHGYSLPSSPFKVYVKDLGTGLYGVAYSGGIFSDPYIEVNKNFAWAPPNNDPAGTAKGAMKVTAAHEFFHQVQYATLSGPSRAGESWWLESTATFMEDEVFDYVNDYYNYLPTFYSNTNRSLDTIGGGYETVLINKLLKESYNGGNADVVKDVMNGIGLFTSAEESMNAVLTGKGANMKDGFQRFALWNLMTGSRAGGGYYAEAAQYPTFSNFQGNYTLGPANAAHRNITANVPKLAAHYFRITPEAAQTVGKSMTVEVQRASDAGLATVVVRRPSGATEVTPVTFGADNKGKVKVNKFKASNVTEVVLVMSNGDLSNSQSFTWSASLDKPLDLVFLIDTTGSMWDDIANVQAATASIVDTLDHNSEDWRVAVAQYKDFPVYPYGEPSDFPYQAALAFSNNKAGIVAAVNTLSASGGWDWPEAVYSGLMGAITTQGLGAWRPDAHKAIIMMGDAGPHDPEPFTGNTLFSVVAAALSAGVGVSSTPATPAAKTPDVGIMGTNNGAHIYSIVIGWDSDAYNYFSQLSHQTEGEVFRALNASEVVAAILNAIGSASDGASEPPSCEPGAKLTWAAPLFPPDPYHLRLADSLDIKFGYGDCGRFIRDESVMVLIQDQATMNDPDAYPVVAWVYGHDIAIDDGARQYSVRFDPSRYGLAAGTTLHISVYFGERLAGQALVVTE